MTQTIILFGRQVNGKLCQVSNSCCQSWPGLSLPVLTLGGTSSEGACSWDLGWGWDCGSVRAGVDDEEDGDEDGWWWCWWGSWLLRRWRFSKLEASGSLKECDRGTMGGVVAEVLDEAMLPLLFKAARWERTLQTTKQNTLGEDGSVCMQCTWARTGVSGYLSLGVFQIGAIREPKTGPWGTSQWKLQEHWLALRAFHHSKVSFGFIQTWRRC